LAILLELGVFDICPGGLMPRAFFRSGG
jgi:hypothetical protein